jgi:hypothetical protein
MKKSERSITNKYEKITRNVKSLALRYSTQELYKKVSPKQINRKKRRKNKRRRNRVSHGGCCCPWLQLLSIRGLST